ncbi:DNA-binding PadR family transcriptional regulator [Thermocatellispora tengchongensis]|uniref:DNA-binding PadR family transcriptional regulator n=2 Tax=Thermocatellispora tengchongensis TaxID=1073253 RepID=A0A840NZR7_9ACTN|nr:DNA-binding PadR family transcriptional regulator [Thermocatellispora tengchongensis]
MAYVAEAAERGFGGAGFAPRVRRGDVRAAALVLLAEEERNGYQIIQEIRERSGGLWRPSPGSVYPALQQLEDEGLVENEEVAGSRRYRLTEAGRAYVEERAEELGEPWAEVARSVPEDRHELRLLWGQLSEAFVHLTHVANDRQVAAAKRLLAGTRRGMFEILSDDGEAEDETESADD